VRSCRPKASQRQKGAAYQMAFRLPVAADCGSLASPNSFPAQFPFANRDQFGIGQSAVQQQDRRPSPELRIKNGSSVDRGQRRLEGHLGLKPASADIRTCLCRQAGILPGKSLARPELGAAFLATPAVSGRQRGRSPASAPAKPRKVKDYSDSARKPELRRTAWWSWHPLHSIDLVCYFLPLPRLLTGLVTSWQASVRAVRLPALARPGGNGRSLLADGARAHERLHSRPVCRTGTGVFLALIAGRA
jgi:hypothetical protein